MSLEITTLPNNILLLKQMLVKQQRAHENQINFYKEQLKLLKDKIFGKKSEKNIQLDENQLYLFDSTEEYKKQDTPAEEVVTIKEHTRNNKGRKSLPKDLPRIEIIHDLSDEEKKHSCGRLMHKIGEETTEKVSIIPEKIIIEKHIRYKYACECEGIETEGKEGAIKIASLPPQIIPKSIATPGLLAYIFTSKFCDALPFYRQTKIFARRGIELLRQNMSSWAIQIYNRYNILQELMKEDIRGGPLIGMDETPVQVMNEEGRDNTTKSYMWVCRGENNGKKILLFNYFARRSSEFIKEYLKNYNGYVQCDAFSAYATAEKDLDITLLGCWAHVRRKFVDVIKVSKNNQLAQKALFFIKKLYKVEKEAKTLNLSHTKIKELRQNKSKEILDKFKIWIDEKKIIVTPKSTLGKAIHYAFNEWSKLIIYLKDGRLFIDNNLVENAIRPFVIGRKNWLFSGCPTGAHASAFFYSLIETAKANDLDPYWYLLFLFEKLPYASNEDDYRKLLPYNVDTSKIASYFIPAKAPVV